MSNVVDKLSFTDRQYMTQIIDFADKLVIKCEYDANENETVESKRSGEAYVLAYYGRDSLYDYDNMLTTKLIRQAGLSLDTANLFTTNKEAFFNSIKNSEETLLLSYLRQKRINEYTEKNPYYLTLNGEPSNEEDIVYIADTFDGGTVELHKLSNDYHASMYQYLTNYNNEKLLQLIDELKESGKDFEYLDHLANRIPYAKARDAKNFDILYYDDSILNEQDMHNFFNEYAKAADYIQTVPYIKAYAKNSELYDRFMNCTNLMIAINNFLILKMDSIQRHKFSTREEKIAFFKDYDMQSIVSSLSDSQMDILINNMDQLIPLKGSEDVITKILELFGIENIDVYKYMLFKTIKSNALSHEVEIDPTKGRDDNYQIDMVRVPINTNKDAQSVAKYINDTSMHMDPKSIMLNDKYFGNIEYPSESGKTGKEEYYDKIMSQLKNSEEFSYLYTKYIGIISHINITQALIKATYLFQQLFHDSTSLDLTCQTDLQATITCRDLIAAINFILTLRFNMSDEIMTDVSNTARIMGFNSTPDLNELREMDTYVFKDGSGDGETVNVQLRDVISDDEIFVVRNSAYKGASGRTPSTGGSGIIVMATRAISTAAPCTTDYNFNITRHDELLEKMEKTNDYNEYMALKKVFDYNMYTLAALQMFEGYTSYTSYLRTKVPELYEYIINSIDSATNSQWDTLDGSARTSEFINKSIDLVSEFVESILKTIGTDDDVHDAIINTYVDNTSVFSKIFAIINLFKSYTVQFSNTDVTFTINNNRDCLIRLFDMINRSDGGDSFRESLALSVSHTLHDRVFEDVVDQIALREWISEYTSNEVATNIGVENKLLDAGNDGKYTDELHVFHKFDSQSTDVELQRVTIRDLITSVFEYSPEERISIQDGGDFGIFRISESGDLVRVKSEKTNILEHSINLDHKLAHSCMLTGISNVFVRDELIEN